MNGCGHEYRGATANPQYVICEICGDCLRETLYPMNMSDEVYPAMLEAKARFGAALFMAFSEDE